MNDVDSIRREARRHIEACAARGETVSIGEAVAFVTRRDREERNAALAARLHRELPAHFPPPSRVVSVEATVEALRERARRYMVAQAAAGREISFADAVTFVARQDAPQSPGTGSGGVFFRAEAVSFKAAAPGTKIGRAFSGVAYAGGVITDHALYSRVAFDLSTTTLQTPAPVRYNHGDPIGVVTEASIDTAVRIAGNIFADDDERAQKVVAMADRGFPWQMSVGIWPGRIEDVPPGKSVVVNGQAMQGPLTVYRDSRIREVSFCALGADDRTSARVQ